MKRLNAALVASAVWGLSACGGGGGGDAPPVATGGTVNISGTAAEGRALAGATVTVKCGGATGTATTAADGSYSVTLAQATPPCIVQATGSGGAPVYRSAVAGGGAGSYTANATPLTELVLAQMAGAAGTTPGALFAAFASQGTAVSQAALATALAYVRNTGLVDLTGVDPLADTLVVGNPLDLKLDALAAKLTAASTTLAELVSTVVSNPATPAVVAQAAQPAAAACASLKSGTYRMINPFETDAAFRAHPLTIDATTLAFTSTSSSGAVDSTGTLVADSTACAYNANNAQETNRIIVTSSGMLVVHSQTVGSGVRHVTLGLPEQSLALADLAGNYLRLGFETDGPGAVSEVSSGLVTFDSTGRMTSDSLCVDFAACTAGALAPNPLAPHAAGGFDLTTAGGVTLRIYGFRAASGGSVLVAISTNPTDPSFNILTPARAVVLPAVTSTVSFWDFSVSPTRVVSALDNFTATTNSVSGSTTVRTRSDGRIETRNYNTPRDGLVKRAINACATAAGPIACNGILAMPLAGLGLSVYGTLSTNTAAQFYGFSPNHP